MLVAGIALVVIIATFGWLVWGRYVLNDTPTWVEQLSLLLIIYITCLGAAVGVRRHTHLSIDFVREGMPAVPRAIMRFLSDVVVIAFGILMGWQGYELMLTNADRVLPMLGVTATWRAVPLFICGVLMVAFAAFDVVERNFKR
ncbi:TRAP transporter small permease [Pararhizobium mangrovi]|uniref:TRAP transporter small permease protein n=2 Tax=Pararhizobium mangrovi TaxID=2590452 RepID=A0A506UA81_9HYPH|nr:TRAP transporter small permease [Pararhizobium mangrovi]